MADEAPPAAIDDATISLRSQSLESLDLASLPATITSLDLSTNRLISLPSSLGDLAQLQSLIVSHNCLTALPKSTSRLAHLEHLDVRFNSLTTLPAGLGDAAASLQLFATPQMQPAQLMLDLPSRTSHTNYRDADFLATAASLFPMKGPPEGHPPLAEVRWLRPPEICKAMGVAEPPALFVGDSDSSDVVQGLIGDCWLLSAVAVVAQSSERLRHVFAYAAVEEPRSGSLTLQLHVRGRWRRVLIDDRLPCAADGSLLYAHSLDGNEMWVALLEKALAKVYGSYEALISGFADGAMRDLTGGLPQRTRFTAVDTSTASSGASDGDGNGNDRLWDALSQWADEGSPVGCAFSTAGVDPRYVDVDAQRRDMSHQGLLFAHAYGLERLASVAGRRLVRLRNPWGRGEWRGAWSDESSEWTAELLAQLDYRFADDGAFWMELSDFRRMFNTLYTARLLGPATRLRGRTGATDASADATQSAAGVWHRQCIEGEWTIVNAAGSPRHPRWRDNPCVLITLSVDAAISALLSQPDPRAAKVAIAPPAADAVNATAASIGFFLARRELISRKGGVKASAMALRGLPLRAERDVGSDGGEALLAAGQYVLVPFTADPNVFQTFRVEIQSSAACELVLVDSVHNAIGDADGVSPPAAAPAAGGTSADEPEVADMWDAVFEDPDEDSAPEARRREMAQHDGKKEREANRQARELSRRYLHKQREELEQEGWSMNLAWADDPASAQAALLQVDAKGVGASSSRRAAPHTADMRPSVTASARAAAASSLGLNAAFSAYHRNSALGVPRTRANELHHESAALVRSAAARLLQSSTPSPEVPMPFRPLSSKPLSSKPARQRGAHGAHLPVRAPLTLTFGEERAAAEAAQLDELQDAQQRILHTLGLEEITGSGGVRDGLPSLKARGSGERGNTLPQERPPGWREALLEAQRKRDLILDAMIARHSRDVPWKPAG